jgi:hypothetical protein
MSKPIPVDAKRQDWPRLVANAVNELQRPKFGEVRFSEGVLQHYDGANWVDVP